MPPAFPFTLIASLAQGAECEQRDLLLGSVPVALGWESADRVVDGRVGVLGEAASSNLTARGDLDGATLTWRFNEPEVVRGLVLQHEADDRLEVSLLGPGEIWHTVAVAGSASGSGLDLTAGRLQARALGVRVSVVGGAPAFVGEVAVVRCPDPLPPAELKLVAGRPDLPLLDAWRRLGAGRALIGALATLAILCGRRGRWGWTTGCVAALLASAIGLTFGVVPGAIAMAFGAALAAWVRKPWVILLAVLIAGASAWTNFGGFRLRGTPIHYHEMFHYYLGSRYAEQLGYDGLYACAVNAELELFPAEREAILARPFRDLATGEMVAGEAALAYSARCRERAGAEWASFRDEVGVFRSGFDSASWAAALRDHGYNPSPAWSVVGRWMGSGDNIQSLSDLDVLATIDPPLLVATFALLAWGFGWEAGAWAVLIWALGWPWGYGFVGGAFARAWWFFLVAGGIVSLRRGAPLAAGALIGAAVALRVFPVVVLLGPALAFVMYPSRRAEFGRLAAGVAGAAVVVGAVSTTLLGGGLWVEFAGRLLVHSGEVAVNKLGAAALAPPFVARAIPLILLAWLWVQVRRGADAWRLVAQGLLVALGVMDLSSYYWVGLALLAPALVGRRGAGLVLALVLLETLVQAGVLSPERQYGVMYFALTATVLFAVSIPATAGRDDQVAGVLSP